MSTNKPMSVKNAILLHPFGIEYALPGTLQSVPYTSKGLGPVNGSLLQPASTAPR